MSPTENQAARPIDLEIRVSTPWGRRGRELEFVVNSPSGHAQVVQETLAGPPIHAPEHFQRQLFARFETFQKGLDTDGNTLMPEELPRELEAIGHDLYAQLIPDSLRSIYRKHRDRIESILVVSDEPWIPWELVRPQEFPDDDFLCMRFRFGRWLTGHSSLVTALRVRRLWGLTTVRNRDELVGSDTEVEDLRKLLNRITGLEGALQPPSPFAEVVHWLEAGNFDLLHFAGHGKHSIDHASDSLVQLLDRPLRAHHLSGAIEQAIRSTRPLVVFNNCQVGRLQESLSQVDGWPVRWVRRCACSGFLAPQWSIRDARARRFAEVFYSRLIAGAPLGQSVLDARRVLRQEEPGEMSWLAYSLYGHPNGLVTFGDGDFRLETPSSGAPAPRELTPRLATHGVKGPGAAGSDPLRGPTARSRLSPTTTAPRRRWGSWRRLGQGFAALGLTAVVTVSVPQLLWPEQGSESLVNPSASGGAATDEDGAVLDASKPAVRDAHRDPLATQASPPASTSLSASTSPPASSPEPTVQPPPPPPPETWEFPRAPRVEGKMAILVVGTQGSPDREVARAFAAVFQNAVPALSTLTPSAPDDIVNRVLDGDDLPSAPDGGTPWGSQFLLVASADRSELAGSSSTFPRIRLALDAQLLDAETLSAVLYANSTHTGTGNSLSQALQQASERCLREVIASLKGDEP